MFHAQASGAILVREGVDLVIPSGQLHGYSLVP
jgi:hypothetical protein